MKSIHGLIAMALVSSWIGFSSAAHADVPPPDPECQEEGDDCERSDGQEGICDVELTCVADKDEGGCSVGAAGAPIAAGSVSALAVMGLAAARLAGRKRRNRAR